MISGFSPTQNCYEAAISLLQEQYGDTDRLIDKHMQQLISMQRIRSNEDVSGLRSLYNSVTACCRTLTSLSVPSHEYYVMLKSVLLRCLPKDLRIEFHRRVERNSDIDQHEEATQTQSSINGGFQVPAIMAFLKKEIDALEKGQEGSSTKSNAIIPSTATNLLSITNKGKIACFLCKSEKHIVKNCDSNLTIQEKRDILRKENRCFRCGNKGHLSKKCRSAKFTVCKNCNGRHMTSMCEPKNKNSNILAVSSNDESSELVANLCACNFDSSGSKPIFLKTARAVINSFDQKTSLLVRCIIDGGSQHSYVSADLVERLKIPSLDEIRVSVMPFGSTTKAPPQKLQRVNLKLKGQYNNQQAVISAIVVPNICVDVLPTPDASCPTLRGFQLADRQHLELAAEKGLSILIGSDFYWNIVTGKQRRIAPMFRAVETLFGWTLQGTHSGGKNSLSNVNLCSFSSPVGAALHLSVVQDGLASLWALESIGIQSEETENLLSANELISKCIHRKGQRYEASLPWKKLDISIKSNRNEAVKRLDCLTRRLLRTPAKFEEYNVAIRALIADGIAEAIPPDSQQSGKTMYLPHRPVYKNDSTTTKMRIVFDASARTESTPALNDLLHVGVNLLPDLFKILLNFRMGLFGIVADVEKAFLQIMLRVDDRDSHRFLWYADDHSSNQKYEYKDFRMTRVTFDVNCSPFLLSATLRAHFSEQHAKYPKTCQFLSNSFYVDDLVVSLDSEYEAVKLCEEARLILKDAGMNLRKWNTNGTNLKEIVESSVSAVKQNVLGVVWFVASDELAVSMQSVRDLVDINFAKGTKRSVLQTIARIFDPLGMLAPVAIKLKILFQEIWKKKCSWDEIVPSELLIEWEKCLKNVNELDDIVLPRAVVRISNPDFIEIHIFSDASTKAYGTVAYIRHSISENEYNVSFLCAKCRVAPLKQNQTSELTLPKLELTAALIAARLCSYLRKSLKITVSQFYLWTDSKIALSWIQGEVGRWKPYVENRVKEIRSCTSSSDWRHCSGKDNPADLLTRGISASMLRSSELWAHGPSWLKNNNFLNNFKVPQISQVRLALMVATPKPMILAQMPLLEYKNYSSWKKLLRITGFVIRFSNSCKRKLSCKTTVLSPDEIRIAEEYWLRYVQLDKFANDVLSLQKRKIGLEGSRLFQLNPFLDQFGIMRVGGRLQCLDESFDTLHPVILPNDCYITELIINDCHRESFHSGVSTVLSQLRQRFWILKGRQTIKRIIKRCITCRKLWSKPASQPFGPIPIERLSVTRPFNNVGVDFGGPFYYFHNPNADIKKGYMMIFTCATVRCIHLENVKNLTTDCCLMGLRRFIARRGIPDAIFSDNARTFRRAAIELSDDKSFSDVPIDSFLSNKRIKWKFIVERAPWWGGFWERLIRVVKNVLRVTIGKARLNWEQLATLVVEAEGIVNMRPFELSPLTPSHFLVGEASSSLQQKETSGSNEIQLIWKGRLRYSKKLWTRWRTEYMQLLRSFYDNGQRKNNTTQLSKGDVVLVFDSSKSRIHWKLAVVEETFVGRDGKTRACEVRFESGSRCRRPIQLLYPLELSVSDSRAGGC